MMKMTSNTVLKQFCKALRQSGLSAVTNTPQAILVGSKRTKFSSDEQALLTVRQVLAALNQLEAEDRQLLFYRYLVREPQSSVAIANRMHLSERTYYRHLHQAIVRFMQAY